MINLIESQYIKRDNFFDIIYNNQTYIGTIEFLETNNIVKCCYIYGSKIKEFTAENIKEAKRMTIEIAKETIAEKIKEEEREVEKNKRKMEELKEIIEHKGKMIEKLKDVVENI